MSKFLKTLEKAWLIAVFAALCTAAFYWIKSGLFDHHVYVPILCSMFCFLIYQNIKGQRKFTEKMGEKESSETNV